MPEIIRDNNSNSTDELDVFLGKNLKNLTATAAMGLVGFAIEPLVKSLTPQDIARMNDFLLKKGINLEMSFAHDQLTDYIFTAGAFLTVNSLVELFVLDKVPDEGKWGIKKEVWQGGSMAISSAILLGGGFLKECKDALISHGITSFNDLFVKSDVLNRISLKDIDQKDMVFYAAGIFAGVVTGYLWNELDRKKAVEIDSQA